MCTRAVHIASTVAREEAHNRTFCVILHKFLFPDRLRWMEADNSPSICTSVHPRLNSQSQRSWNYLCKIMSETTSSLIESADLLGLWVAVQTNWAEPLQPGSSVPSQHTQTWTQGHSLAFTWTHTPVLILKLGFREMKPCTFICKHYVHNLELISYTNTHMFVLLHIH